MVMANDKREQATHELKVWSEYFNALKLGLKNFEIRKNDRDFQIGDTLKLREYDDDEMIYSGDELERTVTYIAQGVFGLPDDVCVMSIAAATAEGIPQPWVAIETVDDLPSEVGRYLFRDVLGNAKSEVFDFQDWNMLNDIAKGFFLSLYVAWMPIPPYQRQSS